MWLYISIFSTTILFPISGIIGSNLSIHPRPLPTHTHTHTNTQTQTHKHKHTNTNTNTNTNKQTNKHTNTQTHKHKHKHKHKQIKALINQISVIYRKFALLNQLSILYLRGSQIKIKGGVKNGISQKNINNRNN